MTESGDRRRRPGGRHGLGPLPRRVDEPDPGRAPRDPEAYRLSSPIYRADGLDDALPITHGLVDDNVHFQDAARLMRRLIELERDFEVMVYPVEPHTVETEASRYDLVRRKAEFFDRELRGGGRGVGDQQG